MAFPGLKAGKKCFSIGVQEGTRTVYLKHSLLTMIFLFLPFFQGLVLDQLTRK